ncbi:MAG TPA: cytochrome P460 family protein [Pyrinomonadaceae bacterium]
MSSSRMVNLSKLSTVVLLLAASCACVKTSGSQQNATKTQEPKRIAGAEMFAGYKNWSRVNPQPVRFHLMRAEDCAVPIGINTRMQTAESPHIDKFVNVFVNDAGRRAMLKELRPRFPVGSLVVKEKLPAYDAKEPELLTAMYKREAGYDPEGGDWEYLVLDGQGREVRARGKLESCRACHQAAADTDFVTRHYLPQDIRRKLK